MSTSLSKQKITKSHSDLIVATKEANYTLCLKILTSETIANDCLSKCFINSLISKNFNISKLIFDSFIDKYNKHNDFEKSFITSICMFGNVEIFDYAISKIQLKDKNFNLLDEICIHGNIEILKFVLHDSKFNFSVDSFFETSLFASLLGGQRIEIIEYLLFEKNLKITSEMMDEINTDGYYMDITIRDNILSLIKTRDLYQSIEQKIPFPDKKNAIFHKI